MGVECLPHRALLAVQLARSVRDLRPFPSAPREFAARALLERLARRATGGRLGVYIARPREPRPRSVPHRSPCTSRWPRSGISRHFPLRRVNSARVHPEDSPDGYLPVGQVILPLAPVIRALVQYRAALQRRSVHHARGVTSVASGLSAFLFFFFLRRRKKSSQLSWVRSPR